MDTSEAKRQHLVLKLDVAMAIIVNLYMTGRLKSNIRGLQHARIGCEKDTVPLFVMENVARLITNLYCKALAGKPTVSNMLQLMILLLMTW